MDQKSYYRWSLPDEDDKKIGNMMQTRHSTLIAAPHLSFGELQGQLTELGWEMESASETPIIAGEPELAVFIHRPDQTSVHYTFNPVVKLRVLQFRGQNTGPEYLRVASAIPLLNAADLRALLSASGIKDVLLGLFAAEEVAQIGVIDQVAKLCNHADARIARTAIRVRDSLLAGALGQAAEHLAAEQSRHPERLAWFEHLPQPELRKQILRWIMHDCTASDENIDQTLRSALLDRDPEVRVTAVIAAARLGAKNVGHALRTAVIPTSTSEGADPRDRFFYERLRQTALRYLALEPPGQDEPNNPGKPEAVKQESGKQEQFRKAVHGELEVRDDPTLLLHALTTPLQLGKPPLVLPEGIELRGGRYFLKRSGLALRWVAPIPHWLGADANPSSSIRNPIRQLQPQNGFFITELPVTSAMVFWSSEPTEPPPDTDGKEASAFLCAYEFAAHLCEVFSELEETALHLPSADQWEMAMRGPDGRLYPWGNCLRAHGHVLASPWGVKKGPVNICEWTSDADAAGMRINCGGKLTTPCAARFTVSAADASAQGVIRLVLEARSA
jgi:hypothetical protein